MSEAPQAPAPREKPSFPPRRDAGAERGDRPNDRARDERGPKPYGKPAGGSGPGFAREPGFDKKKKYAHKPAYAGAAPHAGAADGKPACGKKKKKNRGG
jgi:ATP-dependent RNA helicase DeaD